MDNIRGIQLAQVTKAKTSWVRIYRGQPSPWRWMALDDDDDDFFLLQEQMQSIGMLIFIVNVSKKKKQTTTALLLCNIYLYPPVYCSYSLKALFSEFTSVLSWKLFPLSTLSYMALQYFISKNPLTFVYPLNCSIFFFLWRAQKTIWDVMISVEPGRVPIHSVRKLEPTPQPPPTPQSYPETCSHKDTRVVSAKRGWVSATQECES